MSASHKAALAEGRTHSRAVRNYLEALESAKPKRGRKRTPDSIKRRLADIDASLSTANKLSQLSLLQEQTNLERELASMGGKIDLSKLEKEFVASAKSYSESKGISYDTWRKVGVDAAVLKKAGISRGG